MTSLYRTYRPSTFKEVIGQENIVKFLEEVCASKKPSHAYLFSGGRGTGKTSLARIFAKSLGVQDEDILELDAASNRGIEEVKALKETLAFSPFSSPYKVIILDEAHMLTKEAGNALLKTLEEPPAHVIFILATTDAHKLLPTIVSRCQVLTFETPTTTHLEKALRHVALKEKAIIDDEALRMLSHLGKGSYRDTLGHLERVITLHKKSPVTKDHVVSLFGIPHEEALGKLVVSLVNKDQKALVGAIEALRKDGSHVIDTYDAILETLRLLLLLRVDPIVLESRVSKEKYQAIVALGKECTTPAQSKLLLLLLTHASLVAFPSSDEWLTLEAILLEASS